MASQVHVASALTTIAANRDVIVGCKVRLSTDCANDGANEAEAYRRALAVTAEAKLPLMTHHTFSSVPLEQCPGADGSALQLRKGDVYVGLAPADRTPARPVMPSRGI